MSIYIEILVVNSLILAKTESRFYLMPMKEMALDALMYILGYAIAAFAVGIIREFLAFGSLFGLRVCDAPMPAAKTTFFGFILPPYCILTSSATNLRFISYLFLYKAQRKLRRYPKGG